jgi:hypothetical protein
VSFVLFSCETSFPKFRGELEAEDDILVSEEGSKKEETGGNCTVRSFMICTP